MSFVFETRMEYGLSNGTVTELMDGSLSLVAPGFWQHQAKLCKQDYKIEKISKADRRIEEKRRMLR